MEPNTCGVIAPYEHIAALMDITRERVRQLINLCIKDKLIIKSRVYPRLYFVTSEMHRLKRYECNKYECPYNSLFLTMPISISMYEAFYEDIMDAFNASSSANPA